MQGEQLSNISRIEHKADVLVVGGGLAGLAAATYLARSGLRALLFEKAAPGGRAISQEHSGSLFNLGAHALYSNSPAARVLAELGVCYTGGTPVGVRCMTGGKTYLTPVDPPTLLRTNLLSPAAKWEAGRLLLKLQLARSQTLAHITLREWLDCEAPSPEVRRLIESNARTTTYTNAPGQLSMGAFVEQLQQIVKGKVIYLDGGWQTLVNGLEKTAREAGALIESGARVEAVEHSFGSVTGVRLADGAKYAARAVVLAVSPGDALKLVEGGNRLPLLSWADCATPVRAACLDVSLRRLPQPRNRVVMGLDRPLFLTVQSEFSRVAPSGTVLLYTLKYLDPSASQDAEGDRRELEAWLDQLQPGWRGEVIEQRYLPHMLVSNALVSASQGGAVGRPGPDVPGVRNLYVAGDWVGPEGQLVSASLWSARLSAYAILAGSSVPAQSEVA